MDNASAVDVRESQADGVRLYELTVAPDEVGKVIGRDGRTVHAIRVVVGAAAALQGVRARVEVANPGKAASSGGARKPLPATTGPSDSNEHVT